MDYPGNSHKSKMAAEAAQIDDAKKPEKKIEPIVTGRVVRRKTPLGRRFKETFGGSDAKSVWSFVALDVLLPAAKDMLADAVSQGVERMLFGEARSTSRRTGYRPGGSQTGYVSYNRYSSPTSRGPVTPRDDGPRISRSSRARQNFDEIILATRVEAEEVIDRMFDLVSRYEVVTVADLYELVGVSGEYTDAKWGWTDLRGAAAMRIRDGYLLDLPRPIYLDE